MKSSLTHKKPSDAVLLIVAIAIPILALVIFMTYQLSRHSVDNFNLDVPVTQHQAVAPLSSQPETK